MTATATATTVAERLGLTDDNVESRILEPHPSTRTFTIGAAASDDGWPIVGLSYRCDYRAEEEYGVSDLRKAMCGTDPRRFQVLPENTDHATVFSDVNAVAFSTRPLPQNPKWGDVLLEWSDQDYAGHWSRSVAFARGLPDPWALSRKKTAELRSHGKALGISPLPRRKDDLIAAIVAHPENVKAADSPDCWPGWFHYGNLLVLRADDGITAEAVAAIADAVRNGTVGFSPVSGPFSTGLLITDMTDLGPKTWERLHDQWDWHDARMAELAPVEAELRAKGHRFYFLGKPREGGWRTADGQEDTAVRYWLNGSGDPQPSGWYTLDELRSEKFAEDARIRHAERRR